MTDQAPSDASDLMEALLGIAADDPVGMVRALRPDIRRHVQGACRALVTPDDPGGVSLIERASLALRVALSDGDALLAGYFRGLLTPQQAAAAIASPDGVGRFALLMRFGDTVASNPARLAQPDIDALSAQGLSPQDIVAVTQLAAFVPFQVRLLAGLRAMRGAAAVLLADGPISAAPVRFTQAEVGWEPRIPPVDADHATPAQRAALDACPPAVRRSVYFRTLAQDPESLAERGALFNAVMYAPRGLPRAERELATAIVSMVNGCVYCCSVHARRFSELTRETQTMQRVLDEGFGAPLDPRLRAIVDCAARLTAVPGAVAPADMAPLYAAGLAPLEVLDLVHAVAMFANANRLMQALGRSMPPPV